MAKVRHRDVNTSDGACPQPGVEPERTPQMPTIDPSESARAYLAYHLKRLREARGWSQAFLGRRIHVSKSLVSGFETMQRRPTLKNLEALDGAFSLDHTFAPLFPLILKEPGLPAGFEEYTDAESEAGMIRIYQNFVVAGLLQTPEYARAVLAPGAQPTRLEELIEKRVGRQELLAREQPPAVVALLDASVLRRPFGGRDVVRGQLERLLELAELPHVHVHIVPEAAEICPEGSFTLLSSPGEADLGYAEMAGGKGQLVDDANYVAELGILFELIRSNALTAEDSGAAIRKALEEL
ncbi:helix-turn-helix transcriptional regulator [Actinocorallia sp. API 0066]|uniref:helix-turn-helix domain-containing protein n=1 Tax=Actinocorallia sp. API 0066 TaxID=2896846 RepID=UPI0027DFDAFB|nr:helix-turn-helix transcriptional regulator [Actinocorallia sp. API 0066]